MQRELRFLYLQPLGPAGPTVALNGTEAAAMLLKAHSGTSRETFWIGIQSLPEILNFQERFLVAPRAVAPSGRFVALYLTH